MYGAKPLLEYLLSIGLQWANLSEMWIKILYDKGILQ